MQITWFQITFILISIFVFFTLIVFGIGRLFEKRNRVTVVLVENIYDQIIESNEKTIMTNKIMMHEQRRIYEEIACLQKPSFQILSSQSTDLFT